MNGIDRVNVSYQIAWNYSSNASKDTSYQNYNKFWNHVYINSLDDIGIFYFSTDFRESRFPANSSRKDESFIIGTIGTFPTNCIDS